MCKLSYLSLEKQEDREEFFSYALVFRGKDFSETACSIEAKLEEAGYSLTYLNSEGSSRSLEFPMKLTREEAIFIAQGFLSGFVGELERSLGYKLDVVDNT